MFFEDGPRDSPRLTAKTWQKVKDQSTLEAFYLIWFRRASRAATVIIVPSLE
ncbi:MAG: hypothetical protein MUO26_15305 [Methanotrichaceae archaeon]|nr:hypothetical protein [Methanotrichaceae archaeon]